MNNVLEIDYSNHKGRVFVTTGDVNLKEHGL